jgi:hypothetical protein
VWHLAPPKDPVVGYFACCVLSVSPARRWDSRLSVGSRARTPSKAGLSSAVISELLTVEIRSSAVLLCKVAWGLLMESPMVIFSRVKCVAETKAQRLQTPASLLSASSVSLRSPSLRLGDDVSSLSGRQRCRDV